MAGIMKNSSASSMEKSIKNRQSTHTYREREKEEDTQRELLYFKIQLHTFLPSEL